MTTPGKNLFARYAERMMVENELDAYIGGFHLDALTSGVPLNVDLDTTLTVVAGNLYRLLALKLSRYEHATPETLWRDFLDATGTLHIDQAGVTCALNLRSHHPALIPAGFADLQTPIPWRSRCSAPIACLSAARLRSAGACQPARGIRA